ncbi:MAG: N-acetylmuramoyl-L-alanine amidase [Bacteroidales bacterium]|nr:N-acetylmuramoyl-L-alanine amidase [Bacteroidales bacterium]
MRKLLLFCLALLSGIRPAAAQPTRLRTIVIDAGHGGKDPGAVSKDRKTYEKTLTLDIAGRLAKRIREGSPDVKVVMTRTSDRFVELYDRAAIANKAHGDLFLSIHINASRNTTASGYSLHVLGESSHKDKDLFAFNRDVCRRENAVIQLEDDYSTHYEGFDPQDPESEILLLLMQNTHLAQSMEFAHMASDALAGGPIRAKRGVWKDPFYVLWKTAMPAVLAELGFISNSDDLETLRSEAGRQQLADALYEAFLRYKKAYEGIQPQQDGGTAPKPDSTRVQEVPATTGQEDGQSGAQRQGKVAGELFGIQIFAVSTQLKPTDSRFLGYSPRCIASGKLYKYVIAVSESRHEAQSHLAEIRKRYPSAFGVRIRGDEIRPW